MSSMNNPQRKRCFGKKVVVGGLWTLLGSCMLDATIEEKRDVTGDGVEDLLITVDSTGCSCGTMNYLFIGQENGTFIRGVETSSRDGGVRFYQIPDGTAYFFDGEFYRPSPRSPQNHRE